MTYSSPVAIFLYAMAAFLVAITIIRRLTINKYMVSVSKSPAKAKVIRSNRSLVRMHKLAIPIYLILIPTWVFLHFWVDAGGLFLVVAAMSVLMLVIALEDIQVRSRVIARLSVEDAEEQQFEVLPESHVDVAARLRKAKMIFFAILTLFMVPPLIAGYYTLGGPWWIYAAVWCFAMLAALVGFRMGQKRLSTDV